MVSFVNNNCIMLILCHKSTDEGETASTQNYTPMNQTPKADGDDWIRMAQVAKTTSKSGKMLSHDELPYQSANYLVHMFNDTFNKIRS